MDQLKEYSIPYMGLSLGKHEFEFIADNAFFEAFEFSEIKKGNVKIDVDLEKKADMLLLEFDIEGIVNVQCDRCVDYFDMEVEGLERLIVKFGTEAYEESEHVVVIPSGEPDFNIAQYIYEYIILFLPLQRIHPEDEEGNRNCNPEVIKRLEVLSQKQEEVDPRWAELLKLKDNNKKK